MLPIEESDVTILLIVATSSLLVVLQSFLAHSEFLQEFLYGERPTEADKISYFLFTKCSGLIILGIVPGFLINKVLPYYTFSDYGLSFSEGASLISLCWISALLPGLILVNWFIARRQKVYSMGPPIQVKKWDSKLIVIYSITCTVYLFAFELLFRGFLFFPLANSIGVLPAIFINSMIYGIYQSSEGVKGTAGRFLFNLVLCVAAYHTGTIWVAFFSHVVFTLSNDLYTVVLPLEMRLAKFRNR